MRHHLSFFSHRRLVGAKTPCNPVRFACVGGTGKVSMCSRTDRVSGPKIRSPTVTICDRRFPALMVAPLTSSSVIIPVIIPVIIALQIFVIMAVDGRVGGSDALPVGGWAALAGFLIIACGHADREKMASMSAYSCD